jgi:ring-1,2-phenylacetyl-CoA epoxidase subunit PaaD
MCGAELLSREAAEARAWAALREVMDPEVPVLSLVDLGVVRAVHLQADAIEIVLTPTYSGCPATEVIAEQAQAAVAALGLGPVRVTQQLAPAWTTDWITDTGREALRRYGIAPPGRCGDEASPAGSLASSPVRLMAYRVPCPRCESTQVERLSAFGSTACKALYRCLACREPFEHFKPL